jgi:O-antigen ligase
MLQPGTLPDARIERIGLFVLGAGFVLALGVALAMAVSLPPAVALVVPLLPVGVFAIGFVFRRPLLNLALLLASVSLVITQRDGLGPGDVFFALYFVVFVIAWFIPSLVHGRRLILRTEDAALLIFLVLVPLSLGLTIVWGGRLIEAIPQMFAVLIITLYFPIREACLTYRHGTVVMLAVLVGVVCFAAIRNLIYYQEIVLAAEHVWQYTRARVYVNDSLMMAGSVVSLVLTLMARRRLHILLFAFLHVCCFFALVMTQSRGFWVAFLVGAFFVFILIDRQRKFRLLLLGGTVGAVGTIVALVFLSDFLPLIIAGLTDRLGSLGSATTTDLSLVNRFVESQAVLERILLNPIIGHGMGVPFSFHDITWNATVTGTFIHSGYLSLWYRFGIWGLGIILFVWARSIFNGTATFRMSRGRLELRAAGLAAAAVLVAYILPAQTSNPFVLIDSLFLMTATMGIAAGARARVDYEASGSTGNIDA